MTQLASNRLELSINGIRHNIFRVTPEMGTPPAALLDPHYWAHSSAKLRIGDIIEVLAEDGSYFAELLVRDVGNLFAKVAFKSPVMVFSDEAETAETPTGYEVKWRGPKAKFGVLHGKDVLKDGFVDKTEAHAWLDDLVKKAA
jgi:hypothetical protein